MNSDHSDLSIDALEQIDVICMQFETAWKEGARPDLGEYLKNSAVAHERAALLNELLALDIDYRVALGEEPTQADYQQQLPDDHETIARFWGSSRGLTVAGGNANVASKTLASPRSDMTFSSEDDNRPDLGRYFILEKIGVGGFATVYRAYDQALQRDVAVKVPHTHRLQKCNLDDYLNEARMVARLDHPAIVPVHDAGRTTQGICYVVSKFIHGQSLAQAMREAHPTLNESLEIVARIAEALAFAHQRGVVHRDLKPSNILLDGKRHAFVTDFGLAFELDAPNGSCGFAGTPAYMSPEQAAGEAHLIDHRTDIFSLGAILYELLTRTRPFSGVGVQELLRAIREGSVVSPQQLVASIPDGIDRACMKALAPRISDRYHSMQQLVDDLVAPRSLPTSPPPARDLQVRPKGLRSFDHEDAESFLTLLAGPYDQVGLPESLSFWIKRIEPGARAPFRLGLLSGQSGSGKSSLVKAGIIPRLSSNVKSIFVEASSDGTKAKLISAIQRAFPELGGAGLLESFTNLRRSAASQKCVVFIDQFEQWLQHEDFRGNELIAALRHSDGEHLQCVLMVRDEFCMEAARLLHELDVAIEQGENFAVVSALPQKHAKKILVEFGQSLGQLPKNAESISNDQQDFLDAAIEGLSERARVIPVRLALFTEIMRDRPWTSKTLVETGGAHGLGIVYLDQSLGAEVTHPECRLHRNAACRVLRALLPGRGSDIKGQHRTEAELLEASGYANSPKQFAGLMRLLDRELRLVTPAEIPEFSSDHEETPKAYLLAHDFMVAPLRDWLTQKDKQSIRGRAELCLTERASWWQDHPSTRQLPSLREWIEIHLFAHSRGWTTLEKEMMRRANRVHLLRYGLLMVAGLVAVFLIQRSIASQSAQKLTVAVVNAQSENLPALVDEVETQGSSIAKGLRTLAADPSLENDQRLNVLIALERIGDDSQDELVECMLRANAESFRTACDLLQHRGRDLTSRFESYWSGVEASPETRFRVICALAQFDASQVSLDQEDSEFVTRHLLAKNLMELPVFSQLLRPVTKQLSPSLRRHFVDTSNPKLRHLAATILGELYEHDLDTLLQLSQECAGPQLEVLASVINQSHHEAALKRLREQWRRDFNPPPSASPQVSHSIMDTLESNVGILEDGNAYATILDRSSFESISDELAKSGYVPFDFTEYEESGTPKVAAVWKRGLEDTPLEDHDWNDERMDVGLVNVGSQDFRQILYLYARGTATPFDADSVYCDIRFRADDQTDHLFDVSDFDKIILNLKPRAHIRCLRTQGRFEFPVVPFDRFDAFTVEAWVHEWAGPLFGQGSQFRFCIGDGSSSASSVGWKDKDGSEACSISFGLRKITDWTHVAVVFSDGQVRCYLNGQEIASCRSNCPGPYPAPNEPTTTKHVGLLAKYGSVLGNGDVSSFRISKSARYTKTFTPKTELEFDDQTYLYISLTDTKKKLVPLGPLTDRVTNFGPAEREARRGRHVFLNGFGTKTHSKLCKQFTSMKLEPIWFNVNRHAKSSHNRWQSRWTRSMHAPVQSSAMRRLVNTGTVLWAMGDFDTVSPGFRLRGDNELRSILISRLAEANCDPDSIVEQIKRQKDAGTRQALVIALGDYEKQTISQRQRRKYTKLLEQLFRQDSDPGVHVAIEYVFRRWDVPIPELDGHCQKIAPNRDWTTAPNDHTMVHIRTPSPVPHRLPHFEINDGDYRRNLADVYSLSSMPTTSVQFARQSSPHLDRGKTPVSSITWHQAAQYCNWLSEQASIPKDQWCFEVANKDQATFRPVKDYLDKEGFRLPTIAEWRFACGGGVRTRFFSGTMISVMHQYCWDSSNSGLQKQSSGTKKPNWCGLFDIHGNVSEWCLPEAIRWETNRVAACGGNRITPWNHQEIMYFRIYDPGYRHYEIGFRIARTIKPDVKD